MTHLNQKPFIQRATLSALLAGVTLAACFTAMAQPAQKPLLSATTGAKPNLMIALDNSGSMAYSYQETYGIVANTNDRIELKRCKSSDWSDLTKSQIKGGMSDYTNGNRCIYQSLWGTRYYHNSDQSESYSPKRYVWGSWSSQRSADVNPIYYDARTTYAPRVDASGNALTPSDNVVWVSNQNSTAFAYRVYRNISDEIRTTHSTYSNNPSVLDYTNIYNLERYWQIPEHTTYTTTNNSTPGFTYSYCSDVVSWDGRQMGCANGAWTDVTVKRNVSGSVSLPSGHKRTDCSGNVCTNAQEVANIMNWFRYYAFRAPAVATAIGQAIANPDFDSKLRLGYLSINRRNGTNISFINQTPGITTENTSLLRGVRSHKLGTSDTQSLFTWLYDTDGTPNRNSNGGTDATFNTTGNRLHAPYGGTPLHNVVDKVANYYKVGSGAKENPWATNPAAMHTAAGGANPEMSCRRSFNLLFSDGGWTSDSSTISDEDYDNTDGNTTGTSPFASGPFKRTLPGGVEESFSYKRHGTNTAAGRKLYTPYPGSPKGGLADLTAKYYWHTDLRTALDNEIQTRPGQPAFWQNMTTYTVGYQIQPSGEVEGATSGLTFDQIKKYQTDYATKGYTLSTKPSWATGDLTASDQKRVDDFVQAGFTGGGRGFSAQTADDVRNIFNTVLSDILNASGRDAGVAVSASTSNTSTIAGLLKYNVSYKTLDNSGDIVAQKLDADGNVLRDADNLMTTEWSAEEQIPAHNLRKVFTLSGQSTGTKFEGSFSSLPSDVQAALKRGPDASRVANDASFVDYLRGLDPVADANGKLFRQRASKLGAMVNPPSIYMGGSRDFAYDLSPTGTVTGKSSYLDYVKRKQALPASLLVATNAGMVHDLNAKTGEELAAFMPRRSLKRMLNYANDDYKFEYTLDGPLSEHDIYDGTDWNHLAVGTGGRGERMIYALRSPLNGTSAAGNRIPTEKDFLWEVGPTGGPKTVGSTAEDNTINDSTFNLGHITQPARSGQTEDGQWVVVVNSGHHNDFTNGSRHGLLVLDAMTGATIKKIPLPATYSAGRGLSGVTLVRNAEQRIVAAYAGDANGNLWRFNLRGTDDKWSVSYGKPMFTTANNRPIYGAPAWQAHPKGGTIVVVATGMLLDEADVGDTASSLADKTKNEAIYGIWDPTVIGEADASPFTTVPTSSLLVQSIKTGSEQTNKDKKFYTTTKEPIDWSTQRGWTFALGHSHIGERNIDQVRNVGTSVFINTTVVKAPEETDVETCTAAGLPVNYLYGLRAIDGATQYSFDVDGNGKLDNVSMVLLTNGGFSRGIAFANIQKSEISETLRRTQDSIDTGSGESSTSVQKCVNINKKGIGTEEGAIGLGTYCPVQGWSRSQYQLSAPPVN